MLDFNYIKFKMSNIMPLKRKEETVTGRVFFGGEEVLYLDFGNGYTGEFTM